MRAYLPWVTLGVLAAGLAMAGSAVASHETPTKVFETTIGDDPEPTMGYHVDEEDTPPLEDDRTVDTFQIPTEHAHWYATVTQVHVTGAEVDVNKWIAIDAPEGPNYVVDHSSSGFGAAVRTCPPGAVSCTYHVADASDHWGFGPGTEIVEGTYELELTGHTNAAYTVAVYAFDTEPTPPE